MNEQEAEDILDAEFPGWRETDIDWERMVVVKRWHRTDKPGYREFSLPFKEVWALNMPWYGEPPRK